MEADPLMVVIIHIMVVAVVPHILLKVIIEVYLLIMHHILRKY